MNELVRRCIDTWCGNLITERISKKKEKTEQQVAPKRNEEQKRIEKIVG